MKVELSPDEAASLLVAAIHCLTLRKDDTVLRKAAAQIMKEVVVWSKDNPDDFRYLIERLETTLLFQGTDSPLTNLDDVDKV